MDGRRERCIWGWEEQKTVKARELWGRVCRDSVCVYVTIMQGRSEEQEGRQTCVPILAARFMRRLAMHSTREAPELSMQFRIDWWE